MLASGLLIFSRPLLSDAYVVTGCVVTACVVTGCVVTACVVSGCVVCWRGRGRARTDRLCRLSCAAAALVAHRPQHTQTCRGQLTCVAGTQAATTSRLSAQLHLTPDTPTSHIADRAEMCCNS